MCRFLFLSPPPTFEPSLHALRSPECVSRGDGCAGSCRSPNEGYFLPLFPSTSGQSGAPDSDGTHRPSDTKCSVGSTLARSRSSLSSAPGPLAGSPRVAAASWPASPTFLQSHESLGNDYVIFLRRQTSSRVCTRAPRPTRQLD